MGILKNGLIALVATMALGGVANAAVVDIDPDGFGLGADISHAFSGATLSALGSSPATSAVLVGSQYATNVFVHDGSFGDYWGQTGAPFDARLRVDFASLTDFVSVSFIPNDDIDVGLLQAFSAADVLLDSAQLSTPTTPGSITPLSITRGSADIAYLVAWTGSDTSIFIDKVSYNLTAAVPVPAGLPLLLTGLGGIAWLRRRRTRMAA